MIDILGQQIIKTYYNDYKFFFRKPNVIGIGYGFKITNNINTNEPCIHVFVTTKISSKSLLKDSILPPIYKGIKTDVIETGEFLGSINPEFNTPSNKSYVTRIRPIKPSYCMSVDISTSTPFTKTGTLGYIVTDNLQLSKTYCLLSVNKTFADLNTAPIGKPIIQPAYNNAGRAPQDVVANLLRFIPITFDNTIPNSIEDFNTVDCSVASYNNQHLVQLIDPFIPEIGIPSGITTPNPDETIQWTGCISGHQTSIVTTLSSIIKVFYENNKNAWFKDSTIASGRCSFQDFGALVCNMTTNALGLLFGSNVFQRKLIICNMESIQSALNVKLLTL